MPLLVCEPTRNNYIIHVKYFRLPIPVLDVVQLFQPLR